MKKQLLASTMLVAAGALTATGAAEAKIDVTVNGYFETILGTTFADNEDVFQLVGTNIGKRALADIHNEMEIHFNARTELDNGIKIRAVVELEGGAGGSTGTGPGNDIIDEQYIIVRGNFGQLTLGSEDNAGHLMTIGYMGSWATNAGQNLTFDVGDFVTRPYGAKFNAALNDPRLRSTDDDSDKISYYTPRFAGLQLGASYIPNVSQDQNGSQASTDTLYNNGVALGINFDRKFDQVGIGLAAGYLHLQPPAGAAAGTHAANDGKAFTVAARVDFGPVRVAGGFKRNINIVESNTTSLDGSIFDIGARLTMGPNRFSLTYSSGDAKGDLTTANDRKEQAAMLSYGRTLGPGVTWSLNLLWGHFSGDPTAAQVAANPAGSTATRSSGVGLSTALRLNF